MDIKHDIVIKLPRRTVLAAVAGLLNPDLLRDRTATALHGPEDGWYQIQLDHDPFKREDEPEPPGRLTLREARDAAGLSQETAARAAGCSRTYWSGVESGSRDPGKVTVRLARAICAAVRRDLADIIDFGS